MELAARLLIILHPKTNRDVSIVLYVSTLLGRRRCQICLSGFNVSLAPRYGQVLSAAEVRLWKAQEQFVNLRLVTASLSKTLLEDLNSKTPLNF